VADDLEEPKPRPDVTDFLRHQTEVGAALLQQLDGIRLNGRVLTTSEFSEIDDLTREMLRLSASAYDLLYRSALPALDADDESTANPLPR
jgi:hypothetical protein